MKADFRTKPLEGIGTRKYLVDYQTGFSDTGMHWHDTIESLLIQADILKLYAHIYHCWLREGLTFMDPLYDQTIHRILHTLQQNFAAPPSAYEMAKLLDVSYSHMCRLLQSGLRSSYGELLLFIRIEHAKKMLLTTSKSITEIGFDCGFTDSSYFIKRFKETVGITPKKYRENIVHPM